MIAYKYKIQPTVTGLSTEAEFMATYDTGEMILFVHSMLWDLGIPQEAATVLYEDNDACTAMGNAQKPTPQTMDIKYFLVCDWVERDLMHPERIDTKLNMADPFTKNLQRLTFHGHAEFMLGHVPPKYSPIHSYLVGMYKDAGIDIEQYVPPTFTVPMTAAAAFVCAPNNEDNAGNLWLIVLWHG
jgi:hypothetical protein